MNVQVFDVRIEDRLPLCFDEEVTLPRSDVLCDDFLEGAVTKPKAKKGCIGFIFGRNEQGQSVAVRVEGVFLSLFVKLEGTLTLPSVRKSLQREVKDDIFVEEKQFCHFYGFEYDPDAPTGRRQHRYAHVSYSSLSSWYAACKLRKLTSIHHIRERLSFWENQPSSSEKGDALELWSKRKERYIEDYGEETCSWWVLIPEAPCDGLQILNAKLASALDGGKRQFTIRELDSYNVGLLDTTSYIVTTIGVYAHDLPLKVEESFVDPVTQFLHSIHVTPSTWIYVPSTFADHRVTLCDVELDVEKGLIRSDVPIEGMAPHVSAYYDIETLGLNPATSSVIQISVVFVHCKDGVHSLDRHLIGTRSMNEIKGVKMHCCFDEKHLLITWRRILIEYDPDFVIAYNGVNFDNEFLNTRAGILFETSDFFYLSRYAFQKSRLLDLKLASSGMGENRLRYFDMPGRANFDWFVVLSRDLTQEESYSLDHFGEKFCNQKKIELASGLKWKRCFPDAEEQIIELEENALRELLTPPADATPPNVVTLTQSQWNALGVNCELFAEHVVTVHEGLYYRPVRTKHLAIFDLYHGTTTDRTQLAKYCVLDSELCHMIDAARNLIVQILQYARVFGVIPEWVYFRGQQKRFVKLLLDKARSAEEVPLLLQRPSAGFSGEDCKGFPGAVVNDPIKGFHKQPTAVLDWASLYPSIIMSRNLCHSTIVMDESLFNLPGIETFCISPTLTTRFVKDSHKRGVIPVIIEKLQSERSRAKKSVKQYKAMAKTARTDAEKKKCIALSAVFDGQQQAYKIMSNSIYGLCGTSIDSGAKYPCMNIAATVTFQGRECMRIKKEILPKFYPGIRIIYGDTDSVMVIFEGIDTVESCGEAAERAADLCTDHFQNALGMKKMTLEFEKVYHPYFLIEKKRYMGLCFEPTDTGMSVKGIEAKGIETQRKDTLPLVKDIMMDVRDALLFHLDEASAMQKFKHHMDLLVGGNVPMSKLTIRKKLSSKVQEKTETIAHARVNAKRRERDQGSEASCNEQVEYVIVEGHRTTRTTMLAEDPLFAKENGLKLNRLWYFEHCIEKAVGKMFMFSPQLQFQKVCDGYRAILGAKRLGTAGSIACLLKSSKP